MPYVQTANALRDFILSRPADESGSHWAYGVLPKYEVETSDGGVTPLVLFGIDDKAIMMYIQYCGSADPNGYLVDGADVNTSILVDEIPCATGTAKYSEVTAYLSEVADLMATDGYEVDEVNGVNRNTGTGARVDVVVNF